MESPPRAAIFQSPVPVKPFANPHHARKTMPPDILKLVGAWEDAREARDPDAAGRIERQLREMGCGAQVL